MSTTKLVQDIPEAVEEADRVMREMQDILRDLEEARATRDAKLLPILEQINQLQAQASQINELAEGGFNALRRQYDERDSQIRAFADSHRRELLTDVKAKLFRFSCGGSIRWKFNPKYLKVSGKIASIVAQLTEQDREDLFEVKYALKKAAIKKSPDVIQRTRGLSIGQDEVLIVDPRG